MFQTDSIDKDVFTSYMQRLKSENQEYKAVINSRNFKYGSYLIDFLNAFKSFGHLKRFMGTWNGKIQWRKLCKKYPICHTDEMDNNYECNYFSSERIAIYTCIFGDYDIPQEPLFLPDNCDFYIITDQKLNDNTVWHSLNPKEIIPCFDELSNVQKNRYCKMQPHKIFCNYKYSIYIDGNIKPITDLTEFVNIEMPQGILFHRHKARKCVYEEIEACKIMKKASTYSLDEFKQFLIKENFPHDYGMVECNVIVRDHNNRLICELMEEWWEVFNNFSVKRDQLSMAYLLWKHNIAIEDVDNLGINVQDNPAIRVTVHK